MKTGDASAQSNIEASLNLADTRFGELELCPSGGRHLPRVTASATGDELRQKGMSVNLDGVFRVLRSAAQVLRAGGAVVNFGSFTGHRGSCNHGRYATSMAAVNALTGSLAFESGPQLRERHFPWNHSDFDGGHATESQRSGRRRGLLCSDPTSFITGEIIQANGGSLHGRLTRDSTIRTGPSTGT